MKLYEFTSSKYGKPSLKMAEYEVEEKPKTYVARNRIFNKDEVGKISGYNNDTVLLTENNPSIAAQILIEQKQKEYQKIQDQLNRKDEEIKTLISYIKLQ